MLQKFLLAIAGVALSLSVGGIWWAGNTHARVDANTTSLARIEAQLIELRKEIYQILRAPW